MRPVGIGQGIEILNECPWRRLDHDAVSEIREPGNDAEVTTSPQCCDEFDQCPLALEQRDAVEFRYRVEDFVGTQTRVVPTDRKVCRHSRSSELRHELVVVGQVILKDQREADDNRGSGANPAEDDLERIAVLDELHRLAGFHHHRREISHAEIGVILEADENRAAVDRVGARHAGQAPRPEDDCRHLRTLP